jgi:hypothetical protein
MKTSPLLLHALGLGSLVFQILLLGFTVWFLPTRLTVRRVGLLIFVLGLPVVWLAFSVLAMLLDGLTGNDVPGVGYLVEGFVSGVIGFFVYVRRRSREKNA